MNTSSQGVKDREKEEQLFRNHKDAITFSLLNLRTATAGKIKMFIDNVIDNELKPYIEKDENERYENGDYSKDRLNKNVKKRIDRLRISKRAIHFWLKKLQAEKLIEKNANSEYSLTLRRKSNETMFEFMGQAEFGAVADLPFPPDADREEQFEEVVKRVGAYVMFIFLLASLPKEKLEPKLPHPFSEINGTRIKNFKQRMIKHHINPLFIYRRIFYERFVGDMHRGDYDDNFLYEMNEERLHELLDMYSRKYPDIYNAINDANRAFHNKTYVPYYNKKIEQVKKRFPIFEKEFESLLLQPY